MATVAFQSMREPRVKRYDDAPRDKPVVVDTCIAWSSKGEWVRERFPDFYAGDSTDAPGASGVS